MHELVDTPIHSFQVTDPTILSERPYYADLPQHVFLIIDGDRRYARVHALDETIVYKTVSNKKAASFYRLCLEDLGLDHATAFFLRPESFSSQGRSEENLDAIFQALTIMADDIKSGQAGIDLSKVGFRTHSLASKPWMEAPTTVAESSRLSDSWKKLTESLHSLEMTGANNGKTAHLLINYSGRDEYQALRSGLITDREAIPPIGLIIRTGDGMRMSDGPAHAAFDAHMHLINNYFPAVSNEEFRAVIQTYLPQRTHFP